MAGREQFTAAMGEVGEMLDKIYNAVGRKNLLKWSTDEEFVAMTGAGMSCTSVRDQLIAGVAAGEIKKSLGGTYTDKAGTAGTWGGIDITINEGYRAVIEALNQSSDTVPGRYDAFRVVHADTGEVLFLREALSPFTFGLSDVSIPAGRWYVEVRLAAGKSFRCNSYALGGTGAGFVINKADGYIGREDGAVSVNAADSLVFEGCTFEVVTDVPAGVAQVAAAATDLTTWDFASVEGFPMREAGDDVALQVYDRAGVLVAETTGFGSLLNLAHVVDTSVTLKVTITGQAMVRAVNLAWLS